MLKGGKYNGELLNALRSVQLGHHHQSIGEYFDRLLKGPACLMGQCIALALRIPVYGIDKM